MLEILSYDFFIHALIAGIIVSLISWFLGPLVILRKEPNITHAISYMLFLGIIVSFFFNGNYYIFGILFAILGIIFLSAVEKYTQTSRESSKEILSQIWLAWGIFLIGLLWNLQIDVFNFLFGNILFVQKTDLYLLLWLLFATITFALLFWKNILRVSLSPEIAQSQGINVWRYNFWYLLLLSLFIAFSVKIFWVMLLGAFLVLPGNIWKIFSKNIVWVFTIAILSSLFWVISGLFASYYFDTSAGASIVLILGMLFLVGSIIKECIKQK